MGVNLNNQNGRQAAILVRSMAVSKLVQGVMVIDPYDRYKMDLSRIEDFECVSTEKQKTDDGWTTPYHNTAASSTGV